MDDLAPTGAEPLLAPWAEKYNGLGAPECFALSHACLIVEAALGETCYLVGSAVDRRDFRDVDVRVIMSDEKWQLLFGRTQNGELVPFWSLLCTAISEYLSRRTGLKVDFQIQRRSAVREADWEKPRQPLAIYPINIGPAWRDLR